MPYAENQGVRIHYRVPGAGPPLVLQHGFTDSLESWRELGYVAALSPHYRLILIDARGHGASDKPHDPAAYELNKRAGDVVAVLDALEIQRAHFWGYSMGGWIGFGLAQFAPERIDRLVIGGQHPYERQMEGFRQTCRIGIADGGNAFAAAVEAAFGTMWPGYMSRNLSADFHAYLAVAQDRPSIEHILPGMSMPCLLYAGDADPLHSGAEQASKRIPQAIFVSLPSLGHAAVMIRSDLVVPQVVPFLCGS